MLLREALLGITRDARSWLDAWARDFGEAEATRTADRAANPLAWQLGHIASTQDDVYCLFTGEPFAVPAEVRATCGSGCAAPGPTTRYPSLTELWQMLERTQSRMIALIERSGDDDWDRSPLQENAYFHALGQAIYEIALHENYHVGVIATLRKAIGKPAIG